MCNIKYILCTIFCMCAYLHAAAICSDSISDKFSYKVLENFNYCWDNNIVYEDTNSKDTALFVSSHKYIISPILNAFCNNVNRQSWLRSDIVVSIISLKSQINQRKIYNITL